MGPLRGPPSAECGRPLGCPCLAPGTQVCPWVVPVAQGRGSTSWLTECCWVLGEDTPLRQWWLGDPPVWGRRCGPCPCWALASCRQTAACPPGQLAVGCESPIRHGLGFPPHRPSRLCPEWEGEAWLACQKGQAPEAGLGVPTVPPWSCPQGPWAGCQVGWVVCWWGRSGIMAAQQGGRSAVTTGRAVGCSLPV